jgi:cyclic beta-1,2-glucan synthetase
MATKQHPAFDSDSNPTIAMGGSLRTAAWSKDHCALAPRSAEKAHYGRLWMAAILEAQSWKERTKGKNAPVLKTKWEEAKTSIETNSQILRNTVATGHKLDGDAEILLANSNILRQSLEETDRVVRKAGELPAVQCGAWKSLPRAYAAVVSYLQAVNYEFDEQTFVQYFSAIQETVAFEMLELWQLQALAQLALLESVSLMASELDATKRPGQAAAQAPGEAVVEVANQNVTEMPGAKAGEYFGAPSMVTVLASLRRVKGVDWNELFEQINAIEQILRRDPCDAYAHMDFASRDTYRRTIAHLAKHSEATEQEVARKALELAGVLHCSPNQRVKERESHVGHYLVGDGRKTLEQAIGYRATMAERRQRLAKRWPDFSYILGIELLALAVLGTVVIEGHVKYWAVVVVALFLLPAAECAVALMNQVATTLFPPKPMPKLDFSKGLPEEFTTMVVVPTLLISEAQVARAVRDLEVRFLANRDRNLHFALLTDPPDSAQQFDDKDKLATNCAHMIEALNAKYGSERRGSFFLFHRHRSYNEQEGVWMGWERKRGKLLDLNKLLLGAADNFPVKTGDMSALHSVKYVITLDADTQLPRDAAHRLIGTIAHPLNRAVIDSETNTVVEGYGILQPRVDISIHSANRSRFAAIFSSDAGFDIYARAVSDVYQDLFGEGSFTGKGIYEVSVFHQVLEHRFPSNMILSHDMIEGAYARAGLVSDIEVVDDYPTKISAFTRRKHRWIRGDWQIVLWLLPRVPNFFGKTERNPLSVISRWKILDNLRRSLTEIATFVMLLSGWLFLPGKALYWTLATLAVVVLPTFCQFAMSILRAGNGLFRREFWRNFASDFGTALANLFLRIANLCHQSLVTIDAVVRSIIRMTVTHERLLEWETAAEAELNSQKKSPVETYLEITPWLSLGVGLLLAFIRPGSFLVALPLLVLWVLSKPIGQWLNLPPLTEEPKMDAQDEALLRQSALRTWRVFREFSTAEENWLVPDLIQEPASLMIHNISTTNLGLLMNSRLAATDLGFLTVPEFVADTERTFDSIDRMPRLENGQLYNWYDTRTLEAVKPRFISAVDNGNLVCALWTVKQGCLGAIKEPIFRGEVWRGLRDHLDTIEEVFKAENADTSLIDVIQDLQARAKALGDSPVAWSEALMGFERDVVALEKKVSAEGVISKDALWWTHELSLRIVNLENLLYDFAPWLQPQFAKCRPDLGTRLQKLTLESLPRLCNALDRKITRMLEERDSTVETRSALQLLRSAIARTTNVSKSVATRLERVAARADTLAKSMDFSFFFDAKKKLLFTGYNFEESRFTPSHYDLLASEARSATFAAIAKGDIPQESWLALGRPLTNYQGQHAMLSWTGTMFEYLMPLLWMRTYPNTLLDDVTQKAVQSQQKYAEMKSIPWGISEASCSKINGSGHYHYEAFGIPGMAVSRDLSRDLVVSPYSSFLSLQVDTKGAVENIRKIKDLGWLGQYGFYEAADFTASRLKPGNTFEVVKCWLAHHQGMSLMSVANTLCNGSSQRRFHAEPMVAATERLLHEKVLRTSQLKESAESAAKALEAAAKDGAEATQQAWGVAPKLDTAA